MEPSRAELEADLNAFEPAVRTAAFDALTGLADAGEIQLPGCGPAHNMHCHTFFSYNGYGFSPAAVAWHLRRIGLCAAGIVDFDVLDGVDEFLRAAERLGLRGAAGLETRVFIPEFEHEVINSPGEPGISYHMGMGFTTSALGAQPMLTRLRQTAQTRNQDVLARVNAYLEPVVLDYEADVLPLTPNGNPTERHLCAAYEAKAMQVFPGQGERAAFWAGKLDLPIQDVQDLLDDSPALQGLIRRKTMKQGGAGYVAPEGSSFPELRDFNAFVLEAGAIPTVTWLDGTSDGERRMQDLLDLQMQAGSAALNIIPDRNWNIPDPETRKQKVRKLYEVVDLAKERGLPIVVGTEMNAPGQRLADDFDSDALKPLLPVFLQGAYIIYAHTRLQRHAEMGYTSAWALRNFRDVADKNAFYQEVGARLEPGQSVPETSPSDGAGDVLRALRRTARSG